MVAGVGVAGAVVDAVEAVVSWLGRLVIGFAAAFWVASEASGSEDGAPDEADSSPMAARIAASHAWAASAVGVV